MGIARLLNQSIIIYRRRVNLFLTSGDSLEISNVNLYVTPNINGEVVIQKVNDIVDKDLSFQAEMIAEISPPCFL